VKKAMLLRVGIDKGCGGALAPIFEDGSFEFIPIPESDPDSTESKTYMNTEGRTGHPLAYYLPVKIKDDSMHVDPEFETFTYGDPTINPNNAHIKRSMDYQNLVIIAGLKKIVVY
jgi:hypothetical protein